MVGQDIVRSRDLTGTLFQNLGRKLAGRREIRGREKEIEKERIEIELGEKGLVD